MNPKASFLLLAAFLPNVAFAAFTDVPSTDRDADEIQILESRGIIQGTSPGMFSPDRPVTRAELLKIALEGSNATVPELSATATVRFPDVPKTHSLAKYVDYAADRLYVKGYADLTFKPDQGVTFMEATKVMLAIAGYRPYDFTDYFTADTSIGGYYNMAAQQNLFEKSYEEMKTATHAVAARRDIARAMANVIRWMNWNNVSASEGGLFTCMSASKLADAQFRAYFGAGQSRTEGTHPSEVCLAPKLHYGYAIYYSTDADAANTLVTFRTNTTSPIRLYLNLLKNNNCLVGERLGTDVKIVCDTRSRNPDGTYRATGVVNLHYDFVTGELRAM